MFSIASTHVWPGKVHRHAKLIKMQLLFCFFTILTPCHNIVSNGFWESQTPLFLTKFIKRNYRYLQYQMYTILKIYYIHSQHLLYFYISEVEL
jgi:hypothetical protein